MNKIDYLETKLNELEEKINAVIEAKPFNAVLERRLERKWDRIYKKKWYLEQKEINNQI